MTEVVELAALTATLAIAVGYVPQVVHTWKARCCVGSASPRDPCGLGRACEVHGGHQEG